MVHLVISILQTGALKANFNPETRGIDPILYHTFFCFQYDSCSSSGNCGRLIGICSFFEFDSFLENVTILNLESWLRKWED